MQKQDKKQPDPRFLQFQEQFDADGSVIGFKVPGNTFLYQYNQTGGWRDEKGKLFDKDGYSIDEQVHAQQSSEQSAQDSEIDDDQIVDQFQQMLMEQQQGIIHKHKPQKSQKKPKQQQIVDYKQIDYQEQAKKYIQKIKNKEPIRQGVSPNVWIFFKMRSNLYQRIVPEVEKQQAVDKRNILIKNIKVKIQQKRAQLLKNNPWLNGQYTLEYSGSSLDESVYDRYWYGWVKVSHQKFNQTAQQIKKSNQFAILKSKTFYALKSKFYLKLKMQQTIKRLKEELKDVKQDGAVLIKINNLPEQFPLSFVLDLIQLSGGFLQDIQQIDIVDDFSADLKVKKRTAQIITNIQGYSHDQKQFVWIETQDLKRAFKYNDLFNIEVNAPYKVPIRQVHDTLALENSRQELAKIYDKQQKHYRLVANQNVIRKLLMYRGQTLNIERIVRFEKKQ